MRNVCLFCSQNNKIYDKLNMTDTFIGKFNKGVWAFLFLIVSLTGWADKLITWQCFLSIIVLLACTVLQRWLFLSAVVEKKAVRSFVSPSKRVKRKHDSGPRLKDPPTPPHSVGRLWACVFSCVTCEDLSTLGLQMFQKI